MFSVQKRSFSYFKPILQNRSENIRLFYITENSNPPEKPPMVVLHGLLGSHVNWKSIVKHPLISSKRQCFLLDQRNHGSSDHHSDTNYDEMADDIIRFADAHKFDKFTVLGHSMGGRVAMTLGCKFQDRIDGLISVDSAPVDESQNMKFFPEAYKILNFMYNLSYLEN